MDGCYAGRKEQGRRNKELNQSLKITTDRSFAVPLYSKSIFIPIHHSYSFIHSFLSCFVRGRPSRVEQCSHVAPSGASTDGIIQSNIDLFSVNSIFLLLIPVFCCCLILSPVVLFHRPPHVDADMQPPPPLLLLLLL